MTRTPMAMQQGTGKIPYRAWSPCPADDEMDPRWHKVTHYAYCLGKELLHRQWQTGNRPPVIKVGDDWEESLCRAMQINGPDRRNAKRALRSLREHGLLQVEDGVAFVLVTPEEVSGRAQVRLQSVSGRVPVGFPTEPTIENHSLPIYRSEEIKEDLKRERAREEHVPFQSEPQSEPDIPFHSGPPTPYSEGSTHRQLRVGYEQRFRDAEGVFPNQRLLSKAMPDAVKFCDQKAAHLGKPVEEVIKRLLDGFFADGRAHAEHYPPAFLATNPGQYFEPRVAAAKGGGVTLATTLRAELAKLNEKWRLGNSTPPSHPDRQKLMREIRALAAKIDQLEGKVAA